MQPGFWTRMVRLGCVEKPSASEGGPCVLCGLTVPGGRRPSPAEGNVTAWIIQDGNCDDFKSGAEYRFALEFYAHQIAGQDAVSAEAAQLRHTVGGMHQASGRILRVSASN